MVRVLPSCAGYVDVAFVYWFVTSQAVSGSVYPSRTSSDNYLGCRVYGVV